MITGSTRILGIVADPIAHVRTPERLNALLQQRGCDAVLVPLHVQPTDFAAFIATLPAIRNFAGLVVTIPYKESVLAHCTELTEPARRIGAVNVVRVDAARGALLGGNLDGEGFVHGLLGAGHAVAGQRVYLAGAGGAAKAVAHALAEHGVVALGIHNRNESRARQLVEELKAHYPQLDAHVADDLPERYSLAVNCTSLGLKPGDALPFRLERLPVDARVAEVVMSPDITPLLAAARERGHPLHLGRHMIDAQIERMVQFFGLA